MSLENLMPLKQYVPAVYEGVKEIEALTDVQEQWFQILISVLDKEYARMFIQTSDEVGVQRFESILKITADPKIESLDFRKQRLLTRSNVTLPYSTVWLRAYLNAVIGEHNYELNIDYDNDIITLYGYLLDYSWTRECSLIIRDTKPCNMVFVNIPTFIENVGLMNWWDSNTWNGSIWEDNNVWYDYNLLQSEELVNYDKQGQETDTFQMLLNNMKSVTLNNTHTSQITPTIENDIIYIPVTIPEDIKLLENVKILNQDGTQLVSTDCYIDTPSGTQIVLRLSCYKGKEI